MLDFEKRMAEWRRALTAGGALRSWQVEELEDHLRTAYSFALEEFASESEAWRAALDRTGCVAAITQEFAKEQSMSPQSKALGIALTIGLLLYVLQSGPGGVNLFVHIPSMVFVLALVGGGLVASFGPARLGHALQASLRTSAPLEPTEVDSLVAVFQRGYRLSWMAGVLGFIVGFTQSMANLSDPSMIGRGLAQCSLCLFYGALLAEIFFANGRQWLENRTPAAEHLG